MESLHTIAGRTGTDKAWHRYLGTYEQILGQWRDSPINLMEHGLLGGESAEMWSQYFSHRDARFHFVDIHDWGYRPKDKRIAIYYGSNANTVFMRSVYAVTGPLWVIAEDASHMASHQIQAFTDGWPFIKPGGAWVTEDLHTCHSPRHRDCHITFIEYCAKLATEMQDEKGADGCAAYDPLNPRSDIASIELRKGLAVIRKR